MKKKLWKFASEVKKNKVTLTIDMNRANHRKLFRYSKISLIRAKCWVWSSVHSVSFTYLQNAWIEIYLKLERTSMFIVSNIRAQKLNIQPKLENSSQHYIQFNSHPWTWQIIEFWKTFNPKVLIFEVYCFKIRLQIDKVKQWTICSLPKKCRWLKNVNIKAIMKLSLRRFNIIVSSA